MCGCMCIICVYIYIYIHKPIVSLSLSLSICMYIYIYIEICRPEAGPKIIQHSSVRTLRALGAARGLLDPSASGVPVESAKVCMGI